MSLFQHGDFALHSGFRSSWKIDCDALTADDWETLAIMLKERIPAFGTVVGIPRGGVPFARALIKYETLGCRRVLIVDTS